MAVSFFKLPENLPISVRKELFPAVITTRYDNQELLYILSYYPSLTFIKDYLCLYRDKLAIACFGTF